MPSHPVLTVVVMVVMVMVDVVVMVMAQEIAAKNETIPLIDPIPGLFVRQEATIRKLDGLTAKMSKLDNLENKIDLLANTIQEREANLNVLLESLVLRVNEIGGKVEDMQEKLATVDEKVVKMEIQMDSLIREIGHVDSKVVNIEDKVEDIDRSTVEIHEVVEETWMEINKTLQTQEMMKMTPTTTTTTTTIPTTTTTSTNSTTTNASSLHQITLLLLKLTKKIEERRPEQDITSTTECQETITSLIQPFINTTRYLAATVINRIRISSLAMDKRLEVVLHALSLRHSLLRESLESSITTFNRRLSTHLQGLFRNVEDKLQGVENMILGSEGKIMEAVTVFANTTSSSSSSSSSSSTVPPPQDNQEVLQILDNILHLSNLTLHRLLQEDEEKEVVMEEEEVKEEEEEEEEDKAKLPACLLEPVPGTIINTTTITTTIATKLKETVREALRERLLQLEEQLTGLRIYLSTNLHSHANEVEDRMAGVEAGLLRAVQETISKSNRGLEKLRRASLGYLDAAVTSVSSAAVASSQHIADHLKEAMKEMSLSLTRRLSQVEIAVRATARGGGGGRGFSVGNTAEEIDWQKWWWWWWCLAGSARNGGGGGGGSCISALPGNASSWALSRARCRAVGGDLLIAMPTDSTLRALFHSIPSTDGPSTPSYWLGGQRMLGEWRWVTGALVEGEVREGVTEESEGQFDECLSVVILQNGGVKLSASPCHTPRPALCQLPASSGNALGPPFDPESNEVTPIATRRFLTPEDLNLTL